MAKDDYVHQAVAGSLTWREQVIELAVFLFLIGPSMVLSFFHIRGDGASFELAAVLTILRDLALVALVAFFLWRNAERNATIGCIPRAIGREMALGVVLFFPMLLLTSGLDRVLRWLGLSSFPPPPGLQPAATFSQILLAIVLVAVVAVAEEVIFRGYILRRLGAVTRRPWLAVMLGAMIFAVGHGYEGQAGVITVGFMGLLFGIVAVSRGSLGAPITMHFMQDFLAVVLAPLLARQ
jgi:membrane protease YdiL (CAAX protease family)